MKYKHILPNEKLSKTVAVLEKALVEKDEEVINTQDCVIYLRGQYWVISYENDIIYFEYHLEDYPFFENAFHLMNPEDYAPWKTVDNLLRFRRALREDAVSCRGFSDILEEPLTERAFSAFMTISRAADLIHHGQYTF